MVRQKLSEEVAVVVEEFQKIQFLEEAVEEVLKILFLEEVKEAALEVQKKQYLQTD